MEVFKVRFFQKWLWGQLFFFFFFEMVTIYYSKKLDSIRDSQRAPTKKQRGKHLNKKRAGAPSGKTNKKDITA